MNPEFKTAMRAAGIVTDALVHADGELHRFHITGDKPGTKNGWAVLFENPPAGAFGCWKRGIKETWIGFEVQRSSAEERHRHHKNMRCALKSWEVAQKARHARCRKRALKTMQVASPACPSHPYLIAKRVRPYAIKQYRDRLLVPVYNIDNILVGLQYIYPDGTKRFIGGTQKKGGFFPIGIPKGVIYICEGYATGATIHEATGGAVAVAFDSGNLLAVVEKLRSRFPNIKLVVCADNDQWTHDNPGVLAATQAAIAVGGHVAIPVFTDTSTKPTDFNDLAKIEGLDSVRRALCG